MYRHVYSRLVARRHYAVQEIHEVFKKLLVRHAFIVVQKTVEFLARIALIPTGQAQIALVEFIEIRFAVA